MGTIKPVDWAAKPLVITQTAATVEVDVMPFLGRTRKGGCPSWQDPRSNPVGINRKTLGWNGAAAAFAYGYGKLALLGYKYVGADQLVGGPWPDNEPAVSCMDWKTGQVNAKYY